MSYEFFEDAYWNPAEPSDMLLQDPAAIIAKIPRASEQTVRQRLGEVAASLLLGAQGQLMAPHVKLDLCNFGFGTVLLIDSEQVVEGIADPASSTDTLNESRGNRGQPLLLANKVIHPKRRSSSVTLRPYTVVCNDQAAERHYVRDINLVVVCEDEEGAVTPLVMESASIRDDNRVTVTTSPASALTVKVARPIGVSLQHPDGFSRLREAFIFPGTATNPRSRYSGSGFGGWSLRKPVRHTV